MYMTSLFASVSPATLLPICSLLHWCKPELNVNIMQLQQQCNGSDCGGTCMQYYVQHLCAVKMSLQTSVGMRKDAPLSPSVL